MRLLTDARLGKKWYDGIAGLASPIPLGDGEAGSAMQASKNRASVLIVARPGPLGDGLRLLMAAIPWVEIVGQAGDAASALQMVVEQRPALVLLDASVPGTKDWTILRRIKAEWPRSRCVILADDIRQQSATAAGADVVLLKGLPATKLVEAIEGLVSEQSRFCKC